MGDTQSHHSLESIEATDRWLAHDGPAWLMKHSSRCPFSTWALGEVTAYLSSHPDQPAALVVVQEHRDVSDHIAAKTGVKHETPQMLLIRGGRVVWHASHGRIVFDALEEIFSNEIGSQP